VPPAAGRFSGRHSRPKASCNWPSSACASTPGASILLTTMSRVRPRPAAASIIRLTISSRPFCALMTIATDSTASSAGSAWPMKSGAPGVSSRWMRKPSCSRCIWAACSECCIRFSSGSWSLTVLPFSMLPALLIAPAFSSRASASEVLPAPAGPASASVRIAAMPGCCGTAALPGLPAGPPSESGVGLGLMARSSREELDVGLEPDCGQRRGSAWHAQGQGHPCQAGAGAAACTPIAPRGQGHRRRLGRCTRPVAPTRGTPRLPDFTGS